MLLKRPALGVLLVAVVAMLAAQVFLWSHITDDAYIDFRYATRFAQGEGLTFNPAERVEGFSNPLWVLLLTLSIVTTPFSVEDSARWLGFASAILTVLALFRLMVRGTRTADVIGFGYAALILVATPGFHVYATSGLETPLLGLLVTSAALFSMNGSWHGRVLAALCLGLAAITRPETPLYALLWWLFTGGHKKLLASGWREGIVLAVLGLPFVAYEAFRISYFGDILPNTFAAKPAGTFGGQFGVPYLSQWAMALGGPLSLVAWLLRPKPESDPDFKQLVVASAGPIVAACVFVVYAMSDWMPFGRFLVPVAPLMAACVGAALSRWTLELAAHDARPLRTPLAVVLVASALGASSFAAWNSELKEYAKNEGNHHVMRGTDQVAVGKWLASHIKPGTTIATKRLGGISFYSPKLIVWDLLGLTDREQARFIKNGGSFGGGLSPVEKRMPGVMAAADVPGGGYKGQPGTMEWLEQNYDLVESLRQGKAGFIDVWVLKRAANDVLSVPLPARDTGKR